ncbi:hypothetical protein, partial [Clavibacter zhangzhiyongii]|uniref:hypothetical protein n=1 Tax=Clavibacter zhangzhiyongii TaxID=2768071 RepID=UPI001F28ED54
MDPRLLRDDLEVEEGATPGIGDVGRHGGRPGVDAGGVDGGIAADVDDVMPPVVRIGVRPRRRAATSPTGLRGPDAA